MRVMMLALPLMFTACTSDVGKGKTKAKVAEAKEAVTEAKGKRLDIDVSKSTISALGAKVTGKHLLAFKTWKGTVTVAGDNLTGLEFRLTVSSLSTDSGKLDKHLKSPDFFDVGQHPDATFETTSVTVKAAGKATHEVTGNLSIRGKSKQVTFPATVKVSGKSVAADAEFVINRQDFGVSYPGRADDLIQDNVLLTIKVVAARG
jgi:polyisoprenoid-binding protein YceI